MWWGVPLPGMLPAVGAQGSVGPGVTYVHECPVCHVIHENKVEDEFCLEHRS